jgi:hypothetical protein
MPRWFGRTVSEEAPSPVRIDQLATRLREEQDTNLMLQEQLLELTTDERGWVRMGANVASDLLTRQGLKQISARAWLYYAAMPLIRRAVRLKTYYVWGQGVSISARDEKVNDLVQALIDDEGNQAVLFSHDAHTAREREVELEGNVFLALFTSPATGRVQVRRIPPAEMTDIICSPDDSTERRYYRRAWTQQTFDEVTGAWMPSAQVAYYPDFRFQPPLRDRPLFIASSPVEWDSPVLHVRTDSLAESPWGFPEVYAALDWARAYKEFLEDWASIAKALSRFAWRAQTKSNKVAALRRAIDDNRSGTASPAGVAPAAGAAMVHDGTVGLEAIPKTGATLDAESGRPLAMMVGTALDLPYTMLMGDADLGNLATAKTLDRPTELAMQTRRAVWGSAIRNVLGYAVEASVKAPGGPLRGTWVQDGNRQVVTMPDDVDASIDVDWPSILEDDLASLIDAISTGYETGTVEPETIARLLLTALGISDVDQIIEANKAANGGTFVPPRELARFAQLRQSDIEPRPAGDTPSNEPGGNSAADS